MLFCGSIPRGKNYTLKILSLSMVINLNCETLVGGLSVKVLTP